MTQKYQVKVSMKQAAIVETGIVLKQGDFGMQLEIEVLDFDATGTTPQIVFRKAMGAVESTTITVSGNKYTYTFKGTELDTPGKVFCDLKLKNSTTQRISTASFMFKVVADTMDGLTEEASSYSDTIEQIVSGIDNQIDELKSDIYNNGIGNNITKTPFIITSTPKWVKSDEQYAGIWECQPGDIISIEAHPSNLTVIAFLTDISNMETGNTPSFATGYSNRVNVYSNTFVVYKAPADCHYFWIYLNDGTNSTMPSALYFNGVNVLNDLSSRINNQVQAQNRFLPANLFITGAFLSNGNFSKNETRFKSVAYQIYTDVDLYIHTKEGVYTYIMILNDDMSIYQNWYPVDHEATIHIPKNKRFVIGFRDIEDIISFVTNLVITTEPDNYQELSQSTKYYISSGIFYAYGTKSGVLIKANEGDKINILSSGNAYYYLLSNTEINYKEAAQVINQETGIPTGETSLIIPEGCTYLLIDNAPNKIISITLNKKYDCINHKYFTTFDENYTKNRKDTAAGSFGEIPTSTTDYISEKVVLSNGGDQKPLTRRVIAVNHDDLTIGDYGYIRKVYNKYNYHANFSFILKPFQSLAKQKDFCENVKEMLKDGNDIGLHAIMASSFWWMNKLWDARPNVRHTFAPSLSDITSNYNTNRFSKKIYSTTPVKDIYINANTDKTFGEITNGEFLAESMAYTLFFGGETITGLDLNGNSQTWNKIRWLEYWYNSLIDSSMGFSYNGNDLFANFVSTYEVPEGTAQTQEAYNAFYPDASHLLSGKVVFFDDTTNPHYNDEEYQKVGRFSKGLFKGHASCCNYEVAEVCIQIAKAFLQHYVQCDKFTTYDRHGVKYVDLFWLRDKVNIFDDYTGISAAGEHGRVYDTKLGIFETGQDILLRQGITCSTHYTPLRAIYEGGTYMYLGQFEKRGPYFMSARSYGNLVDYMDLIGSEPQFKSGELYTQTRMHDFFDGKGDLIKYIYDNTGKQITSKTGRTAYVHPYFKAAIDAIRTAHESNMIPVLSLDTIKQSANEVWAIELLCKYCHDHGLEIVPIKRAQEIANSFSVEYKKNYFTNPSFRQNLLIDFKGESDSPYAYIPEGWETWSSNVITSNYGFESTVSTDAETGKREWRVKNDGGLVTNTTRIFGLPSGKYKFSLTGIANAQGSHAAVVVYLKKNRDFIERRPFAADHDMDGTPILSENYTAMEDTTFSCEFTIPENTYELVDNTDPASAFSGGYGDNVSNIMIILYQHTGDDTTFKNPILKIVDEE